MNSPDILLPVATLLGSAIIGGALFAFSSFIMAALARVPSHEGIAAMQSINVVVINKSFLGTFFLTAIASIALIVQAFITWGAPSAPWYMAAGVAYFGGTFVLTAVGNVPLNDQLAARDPKAPAANGFWQHYLDRWTRLNMIRTAASLFAVLACTAGLLQA